ncbi:MAG: hypothetical protein MUO62_11080, partial [Anaerolineales bacterium]|nr:hypothetical protein [Anaerolineales bacterium]
MMIKCFVDAFPDERDVMKTLPEPGVYYPSAAELIRGPDERCKRKYGFQRTLINWMNALRARVDMPRWIELMP